MTGRVSFSRSVGKSATRFGAYAMTSVDCAPPKRSRLTACSSSGSNVVVTNRSKSVICASWRKAGGGAKFASRKMLRSRVYASSRRPRDDRNQQTTSFSV